MADIDTAAGSAAGQPTGFAADATPGLPLGMVDTVQGTVTEERSEGTTEELESGRSDRGARVSGRVIDQRLDSKLPANVDREIRELTPDERAALDAALAEAEAAALADGADPGEVAVALTTAEITFTEALSGGLDAALAALVTSFQATLAEGGFAPAAGAADTQPVVSAGTDSSPSFTLGLVVNPNLIASQGSPSLPEPRGIAGAGGPEAAPLGDAADRNEPSGASPGFAAPSPSRPPAAPPPADDTGCAAAQQAGVALEAASDDATVSPAGVVPPPLVDDDLYQRLEQPGETLKTAATYLVRRNGQNIEFLSPLRDGIAPLERALSADTPELAESFVVAVVGGFALKRDYHGTEVLVAGRSLSGAPWTPGAHGERGGGAAGDPTATRHHPRRLHYDHRADVAGHGCGVAARVLDSRCRGGRAPPHRRRAVRKPRQVLARRQRWAARADRGR